MSLRCCEVPLGAPLERTIAFAAVGRFAWREEPFYLLTQITAATAAAGMVLPTPPICVNVRPTAEAALLVFDPEDGPHRPSQSALLGFRR